MLFFGEGEILCSEGHPCPEVTQVSFEGKMAVVVYLVPGHVTLNLVTLA